MEKIVIFGSTGMTGICAVEAAVKKGLYEGLFKKYFNIQIYFENANSLLILL